MEKLELIEKVKSRFSDDEIARVEEGTVDPFVVGRMGGQEGRRPTRVLKRLHPLP